MLKGDSKPSEISLESFLDILAHELYTSSQTIKIDDIETL